MKPTQKNVLAYIKNTRFNAISFNEDGSRGTHYGNINPLAALSFITAALKLGKRALLFPADFNYRVIYKPELGVIEASAFSQVDAKFFELVLPYAIKSENF